MKKLIAKFIFFLFGWKTEYSEESLVNRCVVIAAPHTSNWDFPLAIAIFWKYEIDVKFFIKEAYTKGIHGWLVRKMGGIGVDQTKKNNLVDYAVTLFKENEKLALIIPAEGTRKRVEKWRKGFYYIARNANVPIVLGTLDYQKKIGGVTGFILPSDSIEDDMRYLEVFYKDVKGRYPENYNTKIF